MFEFWLCSLHIYGNVLFNTSYYVKVENGALLCDRTVMDNDPWKAWKSHGIFLG